MSLCATTLLIDKEEMYVDICLTSVISKNRGVAIAGQWGLGDGYSEL